VFKVILEGVPHPIINFVVSTLLCCLHKMFKYTFLNFINIADNSN